jgi:rod shape-determining protein MreD
MREPKAVLLVSLFVFAGVIIQSTFRFLWIFNVHPDFTLLLIIFVALNRGPIPGMATGFAAGLLESFFVRPFGFYALVKTVIGYILGRLEGTIPLDSIPVKLILVIGATLAKGILAGLGHLVFGIPGPAFWTFVGETMLEALYNLVVALPVFFLLRIMKVFKVKQMEQF